MMYRSETKLAVFGAMKWTGAFGLLFFAASLFLPSALAAERSRYKETTEYDRYFLQYSNLYFGTAFDWRYFKAQAIVESKLKPDSQSQDGAMGIMQIRSKTFREIIRKNPQIWSDPKQPRWNIAAGIYYNRIMWEHWQDHATPEDRLNFMFASYNAGKGPILKAIRLASAKGLDSRSWSAVSSLITTSCADTVSYVQKVNDAWMSLQ